MEIRLGNLNVDQIEKRLGIEFPEDIRVFMNRTHNPNASNIPKGKWHCFDMPFEMLCGDYETAKKIYESVKDKSDECKEALKIGIINN